MTIKFGVPRQATGVVPPCRVCERGLFCGHWIRARRTKNIANSGDTGISIVCGHNDGDAKNIAIKILEWVRMFGRRTSWQSWMRQRNNTSGLKGVSWEKSRGSWQASITVDCKQIHLGRFDSKEEAHAAYCKAAQALHGEFANFG